MGCVSRHQIYIQFHANIYNPAEDLVHLVNVNPKLIVGSNYHGSHGWMYILTIAKAGQAKNSLRISRLNMEQLTISITFI
jgi:hypothetical protein